MLTLAAIVVCIVIIALGMAILVNDTISFNPTKCIPLEHGEAHEVAWPFAPNLTVVAGQIVGEITDAAVNEVQTLNATGTLSGGTFDLSFPGVDAVTLDYDISNANLKIEIEALLEAAGIVGGTVTITNGPLPADTTVTFGGSLAGRDVPLLIVDDTNLTGGGSLALVETTPGLSNKVMKPYNDANTDGSEVARGISKYAFTTDQYGRITFGDVSTGGPHGERFQSAPIYTSGRFDVASLTGLDAAAVTDLGRLESGTISDGVLLITGS